MAFTPLKRLPAYQQVADQIRSGIESGELVPGQALPTEHALAAEFDVSRSTIREALRVLRAQGLVQGGQGAPHRSVVSLGSNVLERAVEVLVTEQRTSLQAVVDLRSCIETGAVHRGTMGPRPEWKDTGRALEEMRRAADRIAAGDDSVGELVDAFCLFHQSIVDAAANELMSMLMRATQLQLASELREGCMAVIGVDADPAGLRQFLDDHEAVLGALEAGDSVHAQRLLHDQEYELFLQPLRQPQAPR
jgi:GntR family transcriptional repressor for pyruvate dehydrogenase complex